MRRGFLNQPKSNTKPGHGKAPPAQQLTNPSPIAVSHATPEPNVNNTANALRSDEDVKRWAHKWGESPKTFYNRLGAQMARMNDSDFKMVYRNVTFKDFQGVVLADVKIHDLIPKVFGAPPSALENAYRISHAAGKGWGMFASRDIPAGAVILVENPVSIVV